MVYRKDINGLRAIAVVAVMLYHFRVPGFTGGYAGVDVFFVISGYLMTSIIFSGISEGKFSLVAFYVARARRILPALTAVCFSLLAIGWLVLFPSDFKALGKHAASAMLFISNIAFSNDASGYFDTAPFEKWLLHTWSLSVEWQFYMLYPLLVLLLRKRLNGQQTRMALLSLAVLSFLLSIVATTHWPVSAFYLLPTRSWEMLAGGLVYLFPLRASIRVQRSAEALGLFLIGYACIRFTHADAWPGSLAIVPVSGAALVLAACRYDSLVTSNPVVKYLGDTSYSIYLWHWPVVVALNYFGKAEEPIWVATGLLCSVGIGRLSLILIERPTRQRGSPKAAGATAVPAIRFVLPSAIVGIMGAAVFFAEGIPSGVRALNSGEQSQFVEHYRKLHQTGLGNAYRVECDFYDANTKRAKSAIDPACTDGAGADTVFLWGDSHAQALSLGLRTLVGPDKTVLQVATSGCEPSLRQDRPASRIENNCNASNRYALAQISRHVPGTVVLAQRFEHAKTDWEGLADELHKVGVRRVILIGPAPNWIPSLPMLVARNHWFDKSEFIRDGIDTTRRSEDLALAARFADSKKLEYVSLIQALCSDELGCRAFAPGRKELMAVDYGHFSLAGSVFAVKIALGPRF